MGRSEIASVVSAHIPRAWALGSPAVAPNGRGGREREKKLTRISSSEMTEICEVPGLHG